MTTGCNGEGGGYFFWGKELTAATMLDYLYAISEDIRTEIADV